MRQKYSNKTLNFIRSMAYDDYDAGQVFAADDFNQFVKVCAESGIKADELLWNFYWNCVDSRREADLYAEEE